MKLISNRAGSFALAAALFGSLLCTVGRGVQAETPEVAVGQSFPVCVAFPATGRWAKENPFDPVTYGKVGGYFPIGSEEGKVVLCTLSLDKKFLRLARAVDSMVAKDSSLASSLIQVADSKGAQAGGYTSEEVIKRIEELQILAHGNKIEHLSFALSATSAAGFASRLGLAKDSNLLVACIAPRSERGRGVVKWVEQLNTSKLTDKAIREIVASLQKSASAK